MQNMVFQGSGKLKKIQLSIACLLLCCCFPLFISANNEATVGGGEFSIGYVKSTAVSVNIRNNPGIMGYKMIVNYPQDIVRVTSVKRGTMTANGNFNSNFESDGKIIVVWNHTAEVKTEGSLFDIIFEVLDSENDAEIKLSYSEADTFNEKYEAVAFHLNNIALKGIVHNDIVKEETDTSSDTYPSDKVPQREEPQMSYTAVLQALDGLFKKYDLETLSQEDTEHLLAQAGQAVDRAAGTTGQTFSSLEGLQFFYDQLRINAAAEQIKEHYSTEQISQTVEKALKKSGANSVTELDGNGKKKFAEAVKESLGTTENILSELENDEVIEAITQLLPKKEEAKSTPQKEKKAIPFALWAIIGLLLIGGVGCLGYIIIKKKQGSKTK